jgi:hypothetical protein
VTALAEIISEVRGALGDGVEALTYPMILVQLPNGNDGLPADVGVFHYHGIRGCGMWAVLCDTGYHKWRQTICGFTRTYKPKRRAFAERCEAVRKDVERVFGIIKMIHILVDSPVLLRDEHEVERVFKMCVMLHNTILRYDGLDTIGLYEDDWKIIDRQLGMTQNPNGHGVVVGTCCVSE